MLHLGLTGGIGAGKSTVAGALVACGAHLIDADQISRDVLEPGTEGLAAVAGEFGPGILSADGSLDRPALARTVFGDDDALGRLNAVVHPLVRAETTARLADLPGSAVVVHDVPLIVENDMAADYHLVVIAGAQRNTRIARLQRDRAMTRAQIESRMAAQADDEQRRRIADVWIDNDGDQHMARRQVERFWHERAAPYAANLARARPAERPTQVQVAEPAPPPRDWPVQAETILQRLCHAGGAAILHAAHVGPTAVPGLAAEDVLDLQLGVADLTVADRLADALTGAGYPRRPGTWYDRPRSQAFDDGAWAGVGAGVTWPKRLHANADPARAVNVHIRVAGSPGWRFALLFRDWLRGDADGRAEYQQFQRRLGAETSSSQEHAAGMESWLDDAAPRMAAWARRTGWRPPTTAARA